MVSKIIGAGVLLLGAAMTFVFPYVLDYQPKPLANGGRLIGAILLIVGIYLVLFG